MPDSTQRLRSLFDQFGVSQIVWIDDDFYVSAQTVQAVIETLEESDPDHRSDCSQLLGSMEIDEMGDWKFEFPNVWKALDLERQAEVFKALLAINPGVTDAFYAANFPNHVVELCNWLPVDKYPPSRWTAASAFIKQLLAANPNSGVLVLVDQDIHNDPGRPTDTGINLIKKASEEIHNDRVVYGLLSQTFSVDEEVTKGKDLASKHKVPMSKFVPLSKDRLRSARSFAEGIRLTFLMMACAQMATEVAATTESAAKNARETLEYMNVQDFYEVIVATSDREGTWEVETLLRLFDVYHSNFMRSEIQTKKDVMNTWTSHIRSLMQEGLPRTARDAASGAWVHNHNEYYDAPNTLNSFHLPLELGDIFKIADKTYVLLGQPCDMSIRKNGERSAKFVTLVEVATTKPQSNQPNAELKFFGEHGESAYVYFKRMHALTLDILDVVVFDPEGICRFSLGSSCPEPCHGAWKHRFEHLAMHYRSRADRLAELKDALDRFDDPAIRAKVWDAALTVGALPGLLEERCSFENDTFTYPIKRIARYKQPRVGALLQQWAAFMSRPAFDPDFGGR